MKTTYQLGSDDLKAAIISYMITLGKPVTLTDEFSVDASGNVTIVVTQPPPVIITVVPPATLPPVISPAPPLVPTAPVVPSPGHTVQVDPPLSVTGWATNFGMYEGKDDTGDMSKSGVDDTGFFIDPATGKNYVTHNMTLRGVSLPREVMLSTFLKIDTWKTEGIDDVWSRNGSTLRQWVDGNKPLVTIDSGGKSAVDLVIVDAGPSAETGNAIDLTGKITAELGTNGKALATYMIVVAGAPIPIRGWSWETGKVG